MIEVQNIHALRMMFSVIFYEWMTFTKQKQNSHKFKGQP